MAVQEPETIEQDKEIHVHIGNNAAVAQPATFRCCPLGVQLYVPDAIEQYKTVDITLSIPEIPDLPSDITLSGVVVHCQLDEDEKLFRVWVFFLDVPEHVRNHLKCVAKESDLLCPFCENF